MSKMNREIISLQIGHSSNEIAVHFWNHFDVEQTNEKIDFENYFFNKTSPRALIVDYRNAFGNLLDENSNLSASKNSSIEIIRRAFAENFWTKNLNSRTNFNRKSLIPLVAFWHQENVQENPFEIFPVGEQTFKTMFDEFETSLHFLLESSDSLQSFRCLFDVNNSFSGLFTSIQTYLIDECPKRPIWSFAAENSVSSTLNFALTLTNSSFHNEMPTIFSPTPVDPIRQALAIQHVFFSCSTPLDVLVDHLCPQKNFLLKLSSKIPLELEKTSFFQQLQTNELLPLDDPIAVRCFIRGIDENQLFNRSLHNLPFSTSAELLSTFFNEKFGSKTFVSTSSWTDKFSGRFSNEYFDRIPLITALSNEPKFSADLIEKLDKDLKKIRWKTLSQRWSENEFDEQRFDELVNDVQTLNEQSHHRFDQL